MKVTLALLSLLGAVLLSQALLPSSSSDDPAGKITLPAKSGVIEKPDLPRVAEVVRMKPDDWRARLESGSDAVDPATRADILHLAGELEELLAAGANPRDDEARVYAEAILALLQHRAED